jgi:hypothetical protein
MVSEPSPTHYVLRVREGLYLSGIWVCDDRLENALIFRSVENAQAYLRQEGPRPEWVLGCEVCELTADGRVVPVG